MEQFSSGLLASRAYSLQSEPVAGFAFVKASPWMCLRWHRSIRYTVALKRLLKVTCFCVDTWGSKHLRYSYLDPFGLILACAELAHVYATALAVNAGFPSVRAAPLTTVHRVLCLTVLIARLCARASWFQNNRQTSTQHLRLLIPKAIPRTVIGVRNFKYWVLGLSGF